MTTTLGFVGARLTEARRARGMSAIDLAGIVSVSGVSISKYENGHQKPKLDVFHKISSALNLPRSYFMRTMPDFDPAPVFWRARLSAPPIMRERAAVRLEWMKEVVDYIANYFELSALDLPDIPVPRFDAIDSDFIEETATAIRQHWSIRNGPMPDVIEKLETSGVLVSRINVGAEKLDAFSQWSDRFHIPFIVLSRDKASAARQRFDALHELAHIVIHKRVPQKRLNDKGTYKIIEKQADLVASCLLLPADEFLEELYAPSLDAFLEIKERWGVSVGAMIMRCKALGIIDADASTRMWINYNRRGWRKCEPLDEKMKKEEPLLIRRSFELLISKKVQSRSDILSALPFPPADLEDIADLESGTLTGEQEARVAPILKAAFRENSDSNVVPIFGEPVK